MEEEGNFFDPSERFSELLGRVLSTDDMRQCPATCGQRTKLRRHLVNTPDIVSVGLVWETDRPKFDDILDVSETIGTTLQLQNIYDDLVPEQVRQIDYQLAGIVCYYGKHYSTFMKNSKTGNWMFFDDAAVQEIGRNFQDVMDKCCKSRYLPLLLFYVNPNGSVIDSSTAPRETVPVPGYTQRPKINHDRTSSSEMDPPNSQSDSARRAVTPTPFAKPTSPRDPDRSRRAVTPGPENRHNNKHRGDRHHRDKSEQRPDKSLSPSSSSWQNELPDHHQRQGSFLIAVSKNLQKTEIDINNQDSDGGSGGRARRRSRSSRHNSNVSQTSRGSDLSRVSEASRGSDVSKGSDQIDGPPPSYDRHHGKVSLVKDKVQRQISNASSSRRKTDSVSSETEVLSNQDGTSPNHRSNMAMLNKASMMQRKESFKKGKEKKVHADVIRFVRSPSECSDDTGNGSRNSVSSDDVHRQLQQQQHQLMKQQQNQQQHPHQSKPHSPPQNARDFWRAKSVDANLHHQLNQPMPQKQVSDPTGRHSDIYQRPQDLRARRELYSNSSSNIPSNSTNTGDSHTGNTSTSSSNVPMRPQRKTMDDSYMDVHAGTYVENGFASLPRQKRKPQNHNYVNQSELVHRENSNPTKPVMMQTINENAYISRKAVESILKLQGHNSVTYKQRNAPVKAASPLKVNLEIASQDSGYRSGNGTSPSGTSSSWSNGRNSTASSEDVPQGFPDPPSPRQLETFQYETSTDKVSRPGEQPRGQFAAVRQLQRSESAVKPEQTGRQPMEGRQTNNKTSSRYPNEVTSQDGTSQSSPDHTPQASMSNVGESNAELCSQAEELVNKSLQKEEQGDIHRAILYCTQAMVTLKQAMDIPAVDYQSFIHAQKKHNTCIIRNKSLHKRLSSLDSSDGTLSGGNRSSASSVSADTSASTDTLTGRKSRSRSHSASGSLQNLTLDPDTSSHALQPNHSRSYALTGDPPPPKLSSNSKPSVKALKNKNANTVDNRVPDPKPPFDIYGTLPRKPKNKMSSSVSVPENLNLTDVVLRQKKNPPPPPVRRSSLVSSEAEAAMEAARNYERTSRTSASPSVTNSGGNQGHPQASSSTLAPPVLSHHRQASELSEFSLPPYPDVDQNEYLYDRSEPVPCAPLDTRWAVPANDPGFCRRCHQNQFWIPETGTCLRCDVQKKPVKHHHQQQLPPAANTTNYDPRSTGHPPFVDPGGRSLHPQQPPVSSRSGSFGSGQWSPRNGQQAYNQYTVQYVTTNGNPALDPSNRHPAYCPDKPKQSSHNGSTSTSGGTFSPDEGIGLSSSDTTRQESTTDSDMSENKRSVLELALRFDQSKLSLPNKNLQTFSSPPPSKPQKSVSFRPDLVEPEEARHRKAGYDSDYDDDTSDSCGSASPYRCGLCQKRRVEPPAVYCRDCASYMNRFQSPAPQVPTATRRGEQKQLQQQAAAVNEPAGKPKRRYSGTIKTV